MFNNVVLDVFIGLVLIYLLYSLLMTIVSEMLATWMNLRPRILRVSIEKMLNDGYFPARVRPSIRRWFGLAWLGSWIVDFWVIIQRFFLREFKDFKFSFAARFYEVPSINYLTSQAGEPRTFFTQTKPSYISADNFADSLFRILRESGAGTTDMEKVQFTLRFNSQLIQTGSLRQLRDIAESAGTDANLFRDKLKAWYNEMQDRATGWYKRKIQFMLFWLGFIIAAIFNVDSIRIAKILAKDKDARDQLVTMSIELTKDSLRYKDFLVNNCDSTPSKCIVDSGFARINRDIKEANMVLGLGWGTDELRKPMVYEFQSDDPRTKEIAGKVNNNQYKNLKDALIKYKTRLQKDIDSINFTKETLNKYKVDSFLIGKPDTGWTRKRDSALIILQRLVVQKTSDSFSVQVLSKDLNALNQTINTATGNKFKTIVAAGLPENKASAGPVIVGERGYHWYEKAWFITKKIIQFNGFWGFVITGMMISLGAPFWFDLLKKLVSLRGAGVKPEEKKTPPAEVDLTRNTVPQLPPQSPTTPPSASADKVAMVLESLTQKSRDEAGIVMIAIEYKADSSPFLLMVADNQESKDFLEKKYGREEKLSDGFTVPIEYSIDSEIMVHLAKSGSEIANETQALGSGTLGCHLKRKGSNDLYFISCWHVMKDNSKWDEAPLNSTIVTNGAALGRIEKGFLSHHPQIGIDIAVAKYNNASDAEPAPNFVITSQHRAVTARDFVLQTRVRVLGKVSGLKDAKIFHNRINARIKYPDGKVYLMNDVFSITSEDGQGNKRPPTTQGDSGAVVIDEKGTPLGMIIGGSGIFSYAVKFSNLFDEDKPLNDFFFNI
jgi:hypothetical protein